MQINDGGPAHPTSGYDNGKAGVGMSMRDYFAARMMASELSREMRQHEGYNYDNAAKRAYRMADAMITARSQP